MTRYIVFFLTFVFLSCKQRGTNETQNNNANSDIEKSELTEILITETKLGNIELDKLNDGNIMSEIKSNYPEFNVMKTVGHQDGPNFNIYQVSQNGQEIFYITMDGNDSSLVQNLQTNHKIIKDLFGITVGQKIESAFDKRPNLKLHSDLHQNIYATEENSKIEYRLSGNLNAINDETLSSDNQTIDKRQVAGMQIEYIIWRK